MKLSKIIIAVFISAVFFSCNATRISSSWKAANTVTGNYHNVMVWAILPESDSTLRKLMETHLVNDLAAKGYHAVASLEVYKSKAYKRLSSTEIIDEFKTTGVDAVVTLVLLDKEKEEKYYPPAIFNQSANRNGNLDNYYSSTYEKVFTPGYYVTTTNYFWESNLFEVSADKLVYKVQTKSFDPSTTESLAHENGLLIIKDMLKNKVIKNEVPKEQ